jgi:hypothetical protein
MWTVRVVRDFGDELEADLLEFFRVDLLDLWRGRLSLRRVSVLVRSLAHKPGRSTWLATVDESAAWSVHDYLLARVSDALGLSNFLFIKANSEDSGGLEIPQAIPRPGTAEPEQTAPEFADGREVADWFARMNQM